MHDSASALSPRGGSDIKLAELALDRGRLFVGGCALQTWQLRQRFFGRGAHMPKYPTWVKTYPTYGGYQATGTQLGPRAPYTGHSDPTASTPPFGYAHIELDAIGRIGNLENAQYQFFLGHPMATSGFSQCRVCLEGVKLGERRDHSKTLGCCKIMTKVLKQVPRDDCVICGAFTTKECWDVPLCSTYCEELWKFEAVQPTSVLMEIAKEIRKP